MWKINKLNKNSKIEEIKVFKQFKKQKLFSQVAFVFFALVVGFWINSFVLNWQYWNQLKTSILELNKKIENKADIYFKKIDKDFKSILKINVWKEISQVKDLSLSLIYNPEELDIQDIFSKIKWAKLSRIENEKWVITLIINFEEIQNIKVWTNLIELYVSKTKEKTTQNINIINSNFTDWTWINYELTTSWIIF
jgi:hypothetical protein